MTLRELLEQIVRYENNLDREVKVRVSYRDDLNVEFKLAPIYHYFSFMTGEDGSVHLAVDAKELSKSKTYTL